MLIIIGGLPGTGKTSLARGLASRLDAVHVRIDSIEQAIRESGALRSSVMDAGYRAGCAMAEDNLRLGRTVIADAVNPLRISRAAWRSAAERAGVDSIEVEVICSDPVQHRQRIETRASDIPGHDVPTWGEVMAREIEPWGQDRILVDTARTSLDDCVSFLLGEITAAAVSRKNG